MDETQQPSSGRTAPRQAGPDASAEDAAHWLAALVNSSDDAIISKTLDGVITSWNTAAQQIYGYSAQEIIGQSITLLIPADRLDEFDAIMRRLRHGERIEHLETVRVRRDGTRITVLITISPIIDAQGQIIGASTIARDITARKHADERLAYHALLLDNVHDAVVAVDERLIVTAWNRAAEQLYGWTAAEVLGRDIRDAVHSDFDPEQRAAGYRVLAETGYFRAEAVHHRKDGSPIQIEGLIVTLRDVAERVTGYVYVYRDITERKHSEDLLREAQVRTESILSNVADIHIVFDHQWRYLYVNTAAAQAMGRSRAQILGHTLWELYPDIVDTALGHQYRRAMDERLSVAFDFHYTSNDTWWNNRFSAVPEGLAVFATDITERKRAEEGLRRANEELETQVAERTRELAERNQRLQAEIAERRLAEGLLLEMNQKVEMILESITDRFFALDDEWRYTYFNKHAEEQLRALGKDPASLIGKVLWEEFPNPTSEEELRRSMRERVVAIDEQYFPPLGEWYENRIYPSRDGGVAVFQRYVTERKRAEAQLAYDAHLLENVHDAVIATDERFVLTAWNKGAEQMYGWMAAEVLGRSVRDVIRSELSDAQRVELVRELDQMGRLQTEVTTYRKDGMPVYVEGRNVTLRDEQGKITGYLSTSCDVTARKQAEQARQQLLHQLITAQEDERGRISRELHDGLGQSLTALHLGLKQVQMQEGCPAEVGDEIERLRELALTIDADVDRLTFELRPPALDDLGLKEALRLLVKAWSANCGIPVELYTRTLGHERISAILETTVYRIVQESLTNVLKHAHATRVTVIVERRGGEMSAIIEDDGQGFARDAVSDRPDAALKIGLKGMQERTRQAGGRLDIETSPGAGTTIYVRIPILSVAGEGDSAIHDRSE